MFHAISEDERVNNQCLMQQLIVDGVKLSKFNAFVVNRSQLVYVVIVMV